MVGLESRLTWIIKVLGLEAGVGEGVEAVGLSGFVVEVVVVVGLSISCWWAMDLFLNCVLGYGGCGGCVEAVVGCWQQCGGY